MEDCRDCMAYEEEEWGEKDTDLNNWIKLMDKNRWQIEFVVEMEGMR